MARKIAVDDIGYDWWAERDRAAVSAQYPDIGGEILWEANDEDVFELIEDGFIKWGNDETVYEYMIHLGIIDAPGPPGRFEYFYPEDIDPDIFFEGDDDE